MLEKKTTMLKSGPQIATTNQPLVTSSSHLADKLATSSVPTSGSYVTVNKGNPFLQPAVTIGGSTPANPPTQGDQTVTQIRNDLSD